MNKIIAGFLGLVMVTAVVGGTAYALFSSTATVSGITVTAGNADLRVNDGSTHASSWNTGLLLSNVYPGFQDSTTLQLFNDSTSNINLAVSAQLTAANNWPALQDAVEVAVNDSSSGSTGWHTLAEWNSAPISFTGPSIAHSGSATYTVYVRVPLTYSSGPLAGQPVSNEIVGMWLSNVTFTLTGTQAP